MSTLVKHIPNVLTGARVAAGVISFLLLAAAAGGVPLLSERLTPDAQFGMERWALVAFVVAACTDFFDGWLARKLDAVTTWGAILDPIGDKILICGTILGLAALGPQPQIAIPFALILFREFAISGLRESMAGRGLRLPVTLLAKWKTTIQLLAVGGELLIGTWASWGLPSEPDVLGPVTLAIHTLLWAAAAITLWTGGQYWRQAHLAVGDD